MNSLDRIHATCPGDDGVLGNAAVVDNLFLTYFFALSHRKGFAVNLSCLTRFYFMYDPGVSDFVLVISSLISGVCLSCTSGVPISQQ